MKNLIWDIVNWLISCRKKIKIINKKIVKKKVEFSSNLQIITNLSTIGLNIREKIPLKENIIKIILNFSKFGCILAIWWDWLFKIAKKYAEGWALSENNTNYGSNGFSIIYICCSSLMEDVLHNFYYYLFDILFPPVINFILFYFMQKNC